MIELERIEFVGSGLNRPECVLCHASGRLFVSDWTGGGGVTVVEPDGRIQRILARDREQPLRPNGIALLPGGAFLLAHLGATDGGVWRLDADGRTEPVALEVDGVPLPPTNFVHYDRLGRLWITVSTRLQPRSRGYRQDGADGFIVLVDAAGARIVADDLCYTNECLVHPDGEHLYVNETFARRLSAFDIAADGRLGNKRTIAEFGAGTFPDGMTFDAEGGVWITSIVSNRILRVAADGAVDIVLEDCDPEHVAWVENAFQAGVMDRPHLDRVGGRRLRNVSSLAFGGSDLRTAYLGCLLGDAVAAFPAPVAGHPPPHWTVDLGPLAAEPGPAGALAADTNTM
jgi:sugar lactone lactonase YvrE